MGGRGHGEEGARRGEEGAFEECGAAVQCVVMLWPVMIE
jgi:hypothetical protein